MIPVEESVAAWRKDPKYVAAIGGNRTMIEGPITVREVVRLLWKADRYPCLGNEDWAVNRR
jgi:hypothetical protein